jgi:hypothetical protein
VDADVRVPDAVHATVARFAEGEVVLLPAARQLLPGRRIVGATLRVASLDTARALIGRGQASLPAIVASSAGRSVFLPPSRTHGLWLEFLEARTR